MAKAKKVLAAQKLRKKVWYTILSPAVFGQKPVGETLAEEADQVKGRCITLNLMAVTGDIKKQNVNITFLVNDVKGETAYTTVEKYEMIPSSIRRFVRRMKDRLDDSFVCATKEGIRVRIKPLIITGSLTKGSVKTKVLNTIKASVVKRIATVTYDELVNGIMNKDLQREMQQSVKKLTAIKLVEIRAFLVEKRKKKLKRIETATGQESIVQEEEEVEEDEETEEEKIEKKSKEKDLEEAPVDENVQPESEEKEEVLDEE